MGIYEGGPFVQHRTIAKCNDPDFDDLVALRTKASGLQINSDIGGACQQGILEKYERPETIRRL
jgi:hypothetical protein